MKSVSIIAAAAVMLASSVNAASNDPRECEGKFDLKCLHFVLGCSGNECKLLLTVSNSYSRC